MLSGASTGQSGSDGRNGSQGLSGSRGGVATGARPARLAAAAPLSATISSESRTGNASRESDVLRRPTVDSIPWPSHPLIALWIVGTLVLLIRHAIAYLGATRLARRASVASDDDTEREIAGAAAAVGLTRPIVLGYSSEVESPITFGNMKRVVLLPTAARSWSAARRRAVLLHEAAHASRGDCLSQAIGRFACALLWFHPLIWRAFAHLRTDAERAADDCVLGSGIPAPEYATHLLELAHRLPGEKPTLVALGIISTTPLELRFLAMFDSRRSRAGVTSRAQAVTATCALALVCPLASLRVAAPAPLRHAASPRTSAVVRQLHVERGASVANIGLESLAATPDEGRMHQLHMQLHPQPQVRERPASETTPAQIESGQRPRASCACNRARLARTSRTRG